MANVRDSDTSLWLHNKLGTSNDSWISGSICSQLNKEVLRNIKECFPDLQTQVKLKLLLSFFHIPRRLVEEVTQKIFLTGEILKKNHKPSRTRRCAVHLYRSCSLFYEYFPATSRGREIVDVIDVVFIYFLPFIVTPST